MEIVHPAARPEALDATGWPRRLRRRRKRSPCRPEEVPIRTLPLFPALLCLFLLPRRAGAEALLHGVSPLLACSEPRPSQRMPVRRAALAAADGHCFVVTPDQDWERVGARNGLLLLRRTPPVVGEPPLFFRPADLAGDSARRLLLPVPRHRPAGSSLLPLGLVLAALALAGLRRTGRGWTTWHRRVRALGVVSAEIASQRDRLQVRRLQLVSSDGYGTVRLEKWDQEKRYFCRTRLLPLLASRRLDGQWPLIEARVLRRIERAASAPGRDDAHAGAGNPRAFRPDMDPIDYEHHCALLLRRAGWDAQVTAASGDQGADVMARRNGATLVVQCKLYRSAVGNAAVQQVSAARLHHRARFAAVVSNARYTAAAVALARTNDVHLLHHGELDRFSPELGQGQSGPGRPPGARSAR